MKPVVVSEPMIHESGNPFRVAWSPSRPGYFRDGSITKQLQNPLSNRTFQAIGNDFSLAFFTLNQIHF